MNRKKVLTWAGWIAAAAALIVFILYAWQAGWFALFSDSARLQSAVAETGPWAPFVFFLLQFAQVLAAPIPGNVTTLVGGALFGLGKSFLISTLAVLSGSCVAFALSRRFGMALVRRFVPSDVIDKYMELLRGRSTLILALMFLFPAFPDDMLCFLAGLSPIRFPAFIVLTILTRPWGLLGSSVIGSGTLSMPWWGWGILVVLAAAAFFISAKYGTIIEDKLTAWLKRRFKAN